MQSLERNGVTTVSSPDHLLYPVSGTSINLQGVGHQNCILSTLVEITTAGDKQGQKTSSDPEGSAERHARQTQRHTLRKGRNTRFTRLKTETQLEYQRELQRAPPPPPEMLNNPE